MTFTVSKALIFLGILSFSFQCEEDLAVPPGNSDTYEEGTGKTDGTIPEGEWKSIPLPELESDEMLTDFFGRSNDFMYAVTQFGRFLKIQNFSVPGFEAITHVISTDFVKAIHVTDKNEIWIATQSGKLIKKETSIWIKYFENKAGETNYSFNDLEQDKNGFLWACGAAGIIFRINLETEKTDKASWDQDAIKVLIDQKGYTYFLGRSAFALREKNGNFIVKKFPDSYLYSACITENNAILVGQLGVVIIHPMGVDLTSTWMLQSVGSNTLYDIYCKSDSQIIIVGSNSLILQFNAITKESEDLKDSTIPQNTKFSRVWIFDNGNVYIMGDKVLYYRKIF